MIASGDGVWLDTFPKEALPAGGDGPLAGLTVGVKDNIDVAGLVTTAGLPSYARTATATAPAVERLVAAGAIVVGKTNLDQLATGLVGTRSPYGVPTNPVDARLAPGGSSSGSAVAVARGDVDVALGTDTAGSGRVPAAMCGIVGIKGEPGSVPMDGVVPASPTVDCLSAFAATVSLAVGVQQVLEGGRGQRWLGAAGRFRIGVPDTSGRAPLDDGRASAFERDRTRLVSLGHDVVDVDMAACFAAGDLLYGGPWLADRTAAIGRLLEDDGDGIVDVVRAAVRGGRSFTGTDVFDAIGALRVHQRAVSAMFVDVDVLVVPSVPFLPALAQVAAEPIDANLRLGRYTTFVNMLGLAAVAVPGSATDGFPSSITVIGPPPRVAMVAAVAASFAGETLPAASPPGTTEVAVVGAHLRGQPLNPQLTDRGATFVTRTTTSSSYRLHRLPGDTVLRPGLERVAAGGASIEVEVWSLRHAALGALCDDIAPPLGIGSVELADGRWVRGFICESVGLRDATDITSFGGWRRYLDTR